MGKSITFFLTITLAVTAYAFSPLAEIKDGALTLEKEQESLIAFDRELKEQQANMATSRSTGIISISAGTLVIVNEILQGIKPSLMNFVEREVIRAKADQSKLEQTISVLEEKENLVNSNQVNFEELSNKLSSYTPDASDISLLEDLAEYDRVVHTVPNIKNPDGRFGLFYAGREVEAEEAIFGRNRLAAALNFKGEGDAVSKQNRIYRAGFLIDAVDAGDFDSLEALSQSPSSFWKRYGEKKSNKWFREDLLLLQETINTKPDSLHVTELKQRIETRLGSLLNKIGYSGDNLKAMSQLILSDDFFPDLTGDNLSEAFATPFEARKTLIKLDLENARADLRELIEDIKGVEEEIAKHKETRRARYQEAQPKKYKYLSRSLMGLGGALVGIGVVALSQDDDLGNLAIEVPQGYTNLEYISKLREDIAIRVEEISQELTKSPSTKSNS